MVSFSCEGCNETMIKKKVAPHIQWCRSPVTCIDCSQTFDMQSFKQHNQCITEDQKYQGKLYKPKAPKNNANNSAPSKAAVPTTTDLDNKLSKDEEPTKDEGKPTKNKDAGASSRKTSKSKHSKATKKIGTPLKVSKEKSLKKVLKNLKKELKIKESDLLERITVTPDGQLVINNE